MSLTSHLKDPASPVHRFVRENFPDARAVVRTANAGLEGAATIRPKGAVPWSTVGTAADHCIRYYLGPTHEAGELGARLEITGRAESTLREDLERERERADRLEGEMRDLRGRAARPWWGRMFGG